jgi:hypothetical protein
MEEMDAAINAATSPAVKIWMNWMLAIFVLSLVFIYKHKSARFIFGALALSLPIAVLIFNKTQSVPLIGLAHIIVWIPLAIYLIKAEIIGKTEKLKTPYGIYLILLLSTLFISLYFDIRDVILIALSMK